MKEENKMLLHIRTMHSPLNWDDGKQILLVNFFFLKQHQYVAEMSVQKEGQEYGGVGC